VLPTRSAKLGGKFYKKEAKMKECFVCKSETVSAGVTTQTYQENGHLIVIKAIPCQVCANCGETYLSTEVMEGLEKILGTVQCAEFEIVSYDKAAA
jgi:YgiT-type zinc finger domain-containing protein